MYEYILNFSTKNYPGKFYKSYYYLYSMKTLKRVWEWLTTITCDDCGKNVKHVTCIEEFTKSGYYVCDDCLYGPKHYRYSSDADYEQM